MLKLWRFMVRWLRGPISARHWHPARERVEIRRTPSTLTPWNSEARPAEPPEGGAVADTPEPGRAERHPPA